MSRQAAGHPRHDEGSRKQEEQEETEAGKTGRGPFDNLQGLAELELDWMRLARPEEDGGRGTR